MKNLNTITRLKTGLILLLAIFITSCNNDDDSLTQTCTTQGLFYTIGSSAQVFETEANLTTDFFINSSNGPEVEIYGSAVVFVTTTVNLNQTGTAVITIGNGPTETVAVACLATDMVVGGTMRFAFNGTYGGNPITGEFCVTIDAVQ